MGTRWVIPDHRQQTVHNWCGKRQRQSSNILTSQAVYREPLRNIELSFEWHQSQFDFPTQVCGCWRDNNDTCVIVAERQSGQHGACFVGEWFSTQMVSSTIQGQLGWEYSVVEGHKCVYSSQWDYQEVSGNRYGNGVILPRYQEAGAAVHYPSDGGQHWRARASSWSSRVHYGRVVQGMWRGAIVVKRQSVNGLGRLQQTGLLQATPLWAATPSTWEDVHLCTRANIAIPPSSSASREHPINYVTETHARTEIVPATCTMPVSREHYLGTTEGRSVQRTRWLLLNTDHFRCFYVVAE